MLVGSKSFSCPVSSFTTQRQHLGFYKGRRKNLWLRPRCLRRCRSSVATPVSAQFIWLLNAHLLGRKLARNPSAFLKTEPGSSWTRADSEVLCSTPANANRLQRVLYRSSGPIPADKDAFGSDIWFVGWGWRIAQVIKRREGIPTACHGRQVPRHDYILPSYGEKHAFRWYVSVRWFVGWKYGLRGFCFFPTWSVDSPTEEAGHLEIYNKLNNSAQVTDMRLFIKQCLRLRCHVSPRTNAFACPQSFPQFLDLKALPDMPHLMDFLQKVTAPLLSHLV